MKDVLPKLRLIPPFMMRAVRRGLLLLVTLQAAVVGALFAIDYRRKRYRDQGGFPRTYPDPVQIGNDQVQIFTYGEHLYAAMLDAIRNAQSYVMFETFIWKDDRVGQAFKHELQQAAARGVRVYAIYDVFANLVVPQRFFRFSLAIRVLRFRLLPRPWKMFDPRNYGRDHRKILVVDGEVGFVGGYNIGARYATEWRDTHVRIEGPSVWDLENAFIDFWNAHRSGDMPELPDHGTRSWQARVLVHRNVPQTLIFPIRGMYLEAIDRASQHIYMTHAYFIPDRAILQALLAAAKRGVDVRILLPETSNHVVADWLARGFYTTLLKGGVKLCLYQNAMVHAKTATIDGVWSTVGTANIDRLSLVGNYEINVEFYSEDLARQMEAIFENDLTNARELTLDEWCERPLIAKFSEFVLLPLRPLL